MIKKNKEREKENSNFIKFLGTAGARFVMIRQLRSSGGIWVKYQGTNVIIDPGPGSIVRCNNSRPKLDPAGLDGIILTHKHLDHSGDINVMIEAMTEGGFRRRGIVFAPADSVGENGVIYDYLKGFPEEIVTLREGDYSVGSIKFNVPFKNKHSVDTYGVKLYLGKEIVGLVSDTRYFEEIISAYNNCTVLILNVVFYQKRKEYDHLCLEEAIDIANKVRPHLAIFTHFGMSILKAKPHILEEKIKKENSFIKFAYDGMSLELS